MDHADFLFCNDLLVAALYSWSVFLQVEFPHSIDEVIVGAVPINVSNVEIELKLLFRRHHLEKSVDLCSLKFPTVVDEVVEQFFQALHLVQDFGCHGNLLALLFTAEVGKSGGKTHKFERYRSSDSLFQIIQPLAFNNA